MLEIKIVLEAAELSAAMQRLAEALEGRGITPQPDPAPEAPAPKPEAEAQPEPHEEAQPTAQVPEPQSAPVPEATQPEKPAEKAAPLAEATLADVRSTFIALSSAGLKQQAREIVLKYADKLSNIPADKCAEVLAKLKKLEG